MLFNFRILPLTPPKYGNLASFPSLSFEFPALLHYQELDSLIADSGPIYHDLVRDFYANLSIANGCIFTSKVKKNVIALSLDEFGNFLDIPYEG